MTNRILLILAILSILTISCEKEEVWPQLLVNSDIEDSQLNGWWKSTTELGYGLSRTNTESVSPSHSLLISKATTDTTGFCYWGQTYEGDIPVGKDLVLRAKIKCQNIHGDGVIPIRLCNAAYN